MVKVSLALKLTSNGSKLKVTCRHPRSGAIHATNFRGHAEKMWGLGGVYYYEVQMMNSHDWRTSSPTGLDVLLDDL